MYINAGYGESIFYQIGGTEVGMRTVYVEWKVAYGSLLHFIVALPEDTSDGARIYYIDGAFDQIAANVGAQGRSGKSLPALTSGCHD